MANGSPRMKGLVTIANTYAACVEQPAARIFWSNVAKQNLRVYAADCLHAFAETPAPSEPLYIKIDKQFREWWSEHKHQPPLSKTELFVKVQHAIQGHLEVPWLWQIFIDDILLNNIGFKNTTQKKCLSVKKKEITRMYLLVHIKRQAPKPQVVESTIRRKST